jgi:hypothetical protein
MELKDTIQLPSLSPAVTPLPPPSDPSGANPVKGNDGGGGMSLCRGSEVWLHRRIVSGHLGTACAWPWRWSGRDVASSTFHREGR